MDLSAEVIAASPIKECLKLGDATEVPIDYCDVAVCLNVFEHLTPRQALSVAKNIAAHADVALTVINKSAHDPTHVSLHSNRWWITLLASAGLRYDPGATYACRAAYLRSNNWHERWWRDCLVWRAGATAPAHTQLQALVGFGRAFTVAAAHRLRARVSSDSTEPLGI
jgi:hypothetical protein